MNFFNVVKHRIEIFTNGAKIIEKSEFLPILPDSWKVLINTSMREISEILNFTNVAKMLKNLNFQRRAKFSEIVQR